MKQQAGNYGKGGYKSGQPQKVYLRETGPKTSGDAAKRQSTKNRQKAQARREVSKTKKGR